MAQADVGAAIAIVAPPPLPVQPLPSMPCVQLPGLVAVSLMQLQPPPAAVRLMTAGLL